MAVVGIRIQHVYYDTKSSELIGNVPTTPKPKAKLAGAVILDIYRFFEVAGDRIRFNPRHRVDIEKEHFEGLDESAGRLNKDNGCICLLDPQHLSEEEILAKVNDKGNGFKEIARLCDEKWEEIKTKTRAPSFRYGTRRVTTDQQIDSIVSATDPDYEDPDYVLEQLGLA